VCVYSNVSCVCSNTLRNSIEKVPLSLGNGSMCKREREREGTREREREISHVCVCVWYLLKNPLSATAVSVRVGARDAYVT